VYGPATEEAVRRFQEARGLRPNGICGPDTWSLLVEAGYRLGDRRLYQRKPMTRGDDVADLQRRLAALGFDPGKVDGIFGPDTAACLAEFQRNVGLRVDGIFGPEELQVLERLGARTPEGRPMALTELRELAVLRWAPPSLTGRRVAVAERGGLGALAAACARALGRHGADALLLAHPDAGELAVQANRVRAELFLELASMGEEPGCRCAFWRAYESYSPVGKELAERIHAALVEALGVPALGVTGMAITVLRDTLMPAVLCELGPTAVLVERGAAAAAAIARAVADWSTDRPL